MEIAEFVKTDDMDLERFADEKTIIFLITGPKESTYGTMDSTIIVTNRTYSFRKNITKPSKM